MPPQKTEDQVADEYWDTIPVTVTAKDVLTMVGLIDARIKSVKQINSYNTALLINAPAQAMRERLLKAVEAACSRVDPLFGKEPGSPRMLFIGGSRTSFRCKCGCNVFIPYGDTIFKCNACPEIYESEDPGESTAE